LQENIIIELLGDKMFDAERSCINYNYVIRIRKLANFKHKIIEVTFYIGVKIIGKYVAFE
jgi:hypothetical protein